MIKQTLLGWVFVLLIFIFSLYTLWLSISPVIAETINDCLNENVIAVQVPDTGNIVVWSTDPYVQRMLQQDFVTLSEREVSIVTNDGTPFRRVYYWTNTWRREALLYEFGGEIFLFVFGDDRLPGVKIDRGSYSEWHGACMLQLSSNPQS